MKELNYKTVVIGGGPAGAASALFLREAGEEVCVLEMKEFPRETLCGEFISGEIIEFLKELRLYNSFMELGPNAIKRFKFYDTNGRHISADFRFTGYGLKRSTLDNFLLKSANERGARVIQPCKVKSIKREGDEYLITADGDEELTIKSKEVIAAYGKKNVLDKQSGRAFAGYKSGYNGIKFHIRSEMAEGFDEEEIRIYGGDNIYCGVNKVNEGYITLCFLENHNQREGGAKEQIIKLMNENKAFGKLLKEEFKEAIYDHTVYGTGNIYFGGKSLIEDGMYMAGDAGRVIAPLAGDGMGIAFESARIAADVVRLRNSGEISRAEGEQKYRTEWKTKMQRRLFTASTIQKVIMNNYLRSAGLFMARMNKKLLPLLIDNTRS